MLEQPSPLSYPLIPTPGLKAAPQTYTLKDLPKGEYVNTTGRIVRVRCAEKEDPLGKRPYIYGILEDQTFKVPFTCYKPSQFFQDGVYRFQSAYSHRLDDGSSLLVLTEFSKAVYLPEENPDEYRWAPKIGLVQRPTGYIRVTLKGRLTAIYQSSGLVKRCDECGRVLFEESCPNGHAKGWHWSLRTSGRLSDETGSIRIILPEYLTSKLLDIPISRVLLLANAPEVPADEQFQGEMFEVEPPERLRIYEAMVEDPTIFRSNRHLIVVDFDRSRIYCPASLKVNSSLIAGFKERTLEFTNPEDRWLLLRLFDKALRIAVAAQTGLPEIHGIHPTQQPVELYGAEKARLYLGFELRTSIQGSRMLVEVYPQGLVRESVLDYVAWRRARGASARSIEKTLLTWRSDVLSAPHGTRARIVKVLFKDAGGLTVPSGDYTIPQFWREVHGLKVDEGERPCLVVKPYNVEMELTYPPSMIFYDEPSVWTRASTQQFVNYKKSTVAPHALRVVQEALEGLRIDEYEARLTSDARAKVDAQRWMLHEVREKLLGRPLRATGTVALANGQLYFFPRDVEGVP